MNDKHTENELVYKNDAVVMLDPAAMAGPYFKRRGGLRNSATKFLRKGTGRVAFLGGSITQMQGWSNLTEAHLRDRFPDAKLDFINAAIGGTNSTFGVFRFDDDVLTKGTVDLLFLEFAVNDSEVVKLDNQRQQAMEGIIRKARQSNSKMDILVLYMVDESKVQAYRELKEPAEITHHEQVMAHYNIPVINLALEMTRRLDTGTFVWSDFSNDSCHPLPFGHEQYMRCIRECLDAAWAKRSTSTKSKAYPLPAPLFHDHLANARLIGTKAAQGWPMVRGWITEKVCNYSGPVDVLTATAAGESAIVTFSGTSLAMSAIAGMDAGILEITIDGVRAPNYDLFDYYCTLFHRPIFHILAYNLSPGNHTVQLRMAERHHAESTGHAARILQFGVA